jgi:formylglycine-generating enzyme required for sulfatase activity
VKKMLSKRSVLFYICFILFSLTLCSQTMNEMVVLKQAEFRPDQLINAARKDAMGRVCAGLLVYSDLTGLHFDSNNGVVDVSYQPGRYMVFVSEGERVLYIYKDGFHPLEIILSEYGIYGLKSGQVYQLDIPSKEKDQAKTLPVVFNVTPADATIKVGSLQFISGQAQSLPIGENEVVIEKEGYSTMKEIVTVDNNNIQFNFTLQQIEPVLVKVRSNPDGATIFINSINEGKTNKQLYKFTGNYILRLTKDKYDQIEETIAVSEKGNNSFEYNLQKNDETTNLNVELEKGKTVSLSGVEGQKSNDNMVFVQGGMYQMGSNDGESDEKPVHNVTVSDFYIGKYEVTQKEWQDVMGSNPSATDRGIGDSYPVNRVSWYDILVFCNKLSMKEALTPVYSISGSPNPGNWGSIPTSNSTWDAVTCNWNANGYRLPTEAEWEYAARGCNKSVTLNGVEGYKYSGSNNIDEVAWYDSNSGSKTQPVGTKKPNELGIYDMSGNVWEWCWDWKGSYSSSSQTNPKGASSRSSRVIRGGSWNYDAEYCRVATRNCGYPNSRNRILGFRLLRSSK